jgi:hypothetical protein
MTGIYNTGLIFFIWSALKKNLRYGNEKLQKSTLRQMRH